MKFYTHKNRCFSRDIVHRVVATLPARTGNARVIHPTTNMLSIAVSPYIAVIDTLNIYGVWLQWTKCKTLS